MYVEYSSCDTVKSAQGHTDNTRAPTHNTDFHPDYNNNECFVLVI